MHLSFPPLYIGLTRKEWGLLLAAWMLLALAVWGPVLPASPHQHGFADQRMVWGIPCAMDVLSNLPFALAGWLGLLRLRAKYRGLGSATAATAGLFCVGLLLTSVGSSIYHWHADNASLVGDRLGMVGAFAGLLGLAVVTRISARAGGIAAAAMLMSGGLAVYCWTRTGNLLPWAVVQLGGMGLVLALACMPRRLGALPLNLFAVITWYGVAKIFEIADPIVFEATGQWLSGHTLKHLAAAGAAWPVIAALSMPHALGDGSPISSVAQRRQNGARITASGAHPPIP